MPTWPGTLPQRFLLDGFSMKAQQQFLRSDMDAGPPKQRRRYSAKFTDISGRLLLTQDQLDILRDFYDVDLQGGSLEFDWVHPISGDSASLRFVNEYEIEPVTGTLFFVSLTVEIVPA